MPRSRRASPLSTSRIPPFSALSRTGASQGKAEQRSPPISLMTYRRVSLNSKVSVFFCHTEFFSSISTLLTSQQSSHGSILHFQLMLSSLPISLDLIEAAEFADRSARIVLILRILSNVMSIHLRSVLGR